MTTRKVDIFKVLGNINSKDREYFSELTEDQQKSLHPFVLMRWMSGVKDPLQIMLLNEFVNPYVFSLANHKRLMMDLLTACSPGKFRRYNWMKSNKQKTSNTPLSLAIVKEMFTYSTREALRSIHLIDNDTIMMYAIELGRQADEIRDLKKELRTRKILNAGN